jgi:A/G-specific adenine glycosylase
LNWQSDLNDIETTFAPTLELWYSIHKRNLPWRHTTDPYRIWLSEVILQQTRVAQGKPYYERFVDAYPTVAHMAQADERELLRLWQGLGYYSRARNLHQTARFVTTNLGGKFPTNYHDLLKMKGIGVYTAAAIASFAFGERVPVVDGNVYRVLARVYGIDEDITTTTAKKTFAALATRLIQSATDPAIYNQAIMEFGAIQCTPTGPDCLLCPLQQACVAYLTGSQHRLPVKSKKSPVRQRFFTYLVFRHNGKLALRERTARDVWQNLYDFYLIEHEFDTPKVVNTDDLLGDILSSDPVYALVQQGGLAALPIEAVQLLSHQRIHARLYLIDVPTGTLPPDLQWYSRDDINQLPKPVIITNYLETLLG